MSRQDRRRFLRSGLVLAGLGLISGCGFLSRRGQPPAKVPRIGVLQISPELGTPSENNAAFLRGLADLSYVEGRNMAIEWRYAEGSADRFRDLLEDLVRLPVDLIATEGPAAIAAAKRASAGIPIVMQVTGDPVELGLVESLARPGGNVTGLTNIAPRLSAKRLQQIRDILPSAARVAVLWNGANPAKAVEFAEVQQAAGVVGVNVSSLEVRNPTELGAALEAAATAGPDAVLLLQDALVTVGSETRSRLRDLAVGSRLPLFAATREVAVEAGCVASYGASVTALFYRSATYVDKILRGAKPADLPVEQPTTFDFVINLKTAQTLGLTIPPWVLAQATEIIQ